MLRAVVPALQRGDLSVSNKNVTRDRILVAAEREFAEHGYDGVAMRQIASSANATLSLLHYHFGGKLDLYRSVWEWRYALIKDVRSAALEAFDFDRPENEVVTDLVDLFFRAPLQLADNPETRPFALLFAREAGDPKEAERGVLEMYIQPAAITLINAFVRALPHLRREEVIMRYYFMQAMLIYLIADASKLELLSLKSLKSDDYTGALPHLVHFAVAGWTGRR